MSTADTLVNASSAIVVNDIYRPLTKKKHSEEKQLEIARYASIAIKVIGVLLVPFLIRLNQSMRRMDGFTLHLRLH